MEFFIREGCALQDRQLYQQILGITSPWYVERVELRLEEGEVHVYLAHEPLADWACPECGASSCPLYDHDAERSWRHLDTCQYQTIQIRRRDLTTITTQVRVAQVISEDKDDGASGFQVG